jgi:hypothetical protein
VRTKDIEIGGTYAWSRNAYGNRRQVRVLQTGVAEGPWPSAQKSLVEIELLDNVQYSGWKEGDIKRVPSWDFRWTWAVAEAEAIAKRERERKIEEQKAAARGRAETLREALREAGFAPFENGASDNFVRVKVERIGPPSVTFTGDQVDILLGALRAYTEEYGPVDKELARQP